jgi:nitrogen fixation protein NifU and related proteins
MAIENLYDEVMMDHIKNARNYREIPDAHRKTAAVNRLCGDEITVYLKFNGERIDDVAFRCSSCGISMASASIMTEAVKGKNSAEARELSQVVQALIDGAAAPAAPPLSAELAAVLPALAAVPARRTCAALAWHALSGALDGRQETISVG